MRIERTDGVTRYVFRQSGLSDFLLCPERARLLWLAQVSDGDTAETAIGTATHLAIERFVGGYPPTSALEAAREAYRALSEAPGFKRVKVKNDETALRHIEGCFKTWLSDVYPEVGHPIVPPEHHFKLRFAQAGDVELWLEGIIDYIDEWQPWDWKTCSRISKYTSDGWQLRRWAVQPTVYTWAVRELELVEPDAEGLMWFSYGAMQRGPRPVSAVLSVTRGPRDWAWLEEQLWQIVNMHEAMPKAWSWPLNDQHALCSADWCPAWDMCKGSVTASGQPQLGDHRQLGGITRYG